MSILDGPGEGTWSVFAQKVVEERDELRHKLAGEAAHIKSLEGLLVDAADERDKARAEVARREREHAALLETAQKALATTEADAEQAIHNEAFNERQRIVDWIRAKHLMLSSLAIANCIEQGDHER
jgi:hypothetical protein